MELLVIYSMIIKVVVNAYTGWYKYAVRKKNHTEPVAYDYTVEF